MKIKLSLKEFQILFEAIKHYKYNKKLIFIYLNNRIQIDCSEDVFIELRELCSDYLAEVGFDINYNANETGNILEVLIDKLYF